MTIQEAIKVLKDYNEWRRGGNGDLPSPKLTGEALDIAINLLEGIDIENKKV